MGHVNRLKLVTTAQRMAAVWADGEPVIDTDRRAADQPYYFLGDGATTGAILTDTSMFGSDGTLSSTRTVSVPANMEVNYFINATNYTRIGDRTGTSVMQMDVRAENVAGDDVQFLVGANTIVAATNDLAGQGALAISPAGINLTLLGAGDLSINGDPGVAGQVLVSGGPDAQPAWGAAPAVGNNVYSADGTLAASRKIRADDKSFEVEANNSGASRFGLWRTQAAETLVQHASAVGNYSESKADVDEASMTRVHPTSGTASARIFVGTFESHVVNGANSSTITQQTDGINFKFAGNADMKLNGDPGTAGQVWTSSGPDAAPSWTTSAGITGAQSAAIVANTAAVAALPTNYVAKAGDTMTGNLTVDTASRAQLLLQSATGVGEVLLRSLASTGTNNTVYLQTYHGRFEVSQRVGGTLTRSSLSVLDDGRWTIDAGNDGVAVLPATGGHKGAGTINAKGFFKDGVELGSPSNYITNDASDTTTGNFVAIRPATGQASLYIEGVASNVYLTDTDAAVDVGKARIVNTSGSVYITSLLDSGANHAQPWPLRIYHHSGLDAGEAIGGDQGYGTINAKGFFVDGVEITPYEAPPNTSVLAQAQGLTVRRATTTTINVQATVLLMTDVNGFGSIVNNINETAPNLGGAAANTWNEVWITSSDLATFSAVVRAEGAGRPAATYAAMVSIVRVDGSSQVPALIQVGNTVYWGGPTVLSTSAEQATPTLIDMSAGVPVAAQEVIFHWNAARTAAGTTFSFQLQPQSGADAGFMQIIQQVASTSTQRDNRRDRMNFVEAQQMYYTRASGSWTLSLTVTGYTL